MVEYLSDLDEKWMVREVNIYSLGPFEVVLVTIQFPSFLANISIPGNFVEIQEISENSEIGVRETLFSEACI